MNTIEGAHPDPESRIPAGLAEATQGQYDLLSLQADELWALAKSVAPRSPEPASVHVVNGIEIETGSNYVHFERKNHAGATRDAFAFYRGPGALLIAAHTRIYPDPNMRGEGIEEVRTTGLQPGFTSLHSETRGKLNSNGTLDFRHHTIERVMPPLLSESAKPLLDEFLQLERSLQPRPVRGLSSWLGRACRSAVKREE